MPSRHALVAGATTNTPAELHSAPLTWKPPSIDSIPARMLSHALICATDLEVLSYIGGCQKLELYMPLGTVACMALRQGSTGYVTKCHSAPHLFVQLNKVVALADIILDCFHLSGTQLLLILIAVLLWVATLRNRSNSGVLNGICSCAPADLDATASEHAAELQDV